MSGGNKILPNDPRLVYAPKCRVHPDAIVEDDYHTGNSVCTECGLVIASRLIDETPEWRSFDGTDTGRCGPPECVLRDSSEPTTYLGPPKRRLKDGGECFSGFRKMRSSDPYGDTRLHSAYNQLRGIAARMHIAYNVSDYALALYKQLRHVPQTGGRWLESLSAALLYIASCHKNCPRPLKEFCNYVGSTYKEVSASYRRIAHIFEMDDATRVGTAASYVPRYCHLLELPFAVRKVAETIALGVRQHCLMDGRSPVSVAAGSILLAAELMEVPRTAPQVAKALSCSSRTVRDCYRLISGYRDLLLGNALVFDNVVQTSEAQMHSTEADDRCDEPKAKRRAIETVVGIGFDHGIQAAGPEMFSTDADNRRDKPVESKEPVVAVSDAVLGDNNKKEESTLIPRGNFESEEDNSNLIKKTNEWKEAAEVALFGELTDSSNEDSDIISVNDSDSSDTADEWSDDAE